LSERIPAGGPYRAAVGLHDTLSLEHIEEARRVLATYCRAPTDLCCRLLSILEEASTLVAWARLTNLARSEKYEGIDSGIISLLGKLVYFYSQYIMGALLGYGDDVIVEVLSPVRINGMDLSPGEYVRLDPGKAAALYLAGLARPGEATAIKVGRACKKGEGIEG
jgi:hypothetical protein